MFIDERGNVFSNKQAKEDWEFAYQLGQLIKKMPKEKFLAELDKEQYKKHQEVYEYCKTLARENDGRIIPRKLKHEDISGYVCFRAPLLNLDEESIPEFIEMLKKVNSISIYARVDGTV